MTGQNLEKSKLRYKLHTADFLMFYGFIVISNIVEELSGVENIAGM